MQKPTSSTLFTGHHLIELDEVDSTNTYALQLLSQNQDDLTLLPEGTLITANQQHSGRGQRGSGWKSEPGKNLTLSFIFYPQFIAAEKAFLLSQAISLGVYDFVKGELGAGTSIKWPNDIYFRDLKIAGILIENQIRSTRIQTMVAGIGINVNQAAFPADLPNASSFTIVKEESFDLKVCIQKLSICIEARYLALKSGTTQSIQEDYHKALFRLGEFHRYNIEGTIILAKIIGLSPEGKLMLEMVDGKRSAYGNKEVQFVIGK